MTEDKLKINEDNAEHNEANEHNEYILDNDTKIKEIISNLEKQMGQSVPIEEIIQSTGIDKIQMIKTIDKLKKQGDIFEPKSGFIKILK